MRPPKFLPADRRGGAVPDQYFEQPDRRTYQLMNAVPGGARDRFGFRVQQLGTGGTWLVADQRDQKTGAGR